MISVLTAIAGGRDQLHPPLLRPPGVRWLAYLDTAALSAAENTTAGWDLRPLPPAQGISARRASRPPKILSHEYVAHESEFSIWADACALPACDPHAFLAEFLGDHDIAFIAHERRNHRVEQDYCRNHRVGNPFGICRQLARYESRGFPRGTHPDAPFVCGGLIARAENERTRLFNLLWWTEYAAQPDQDRDQFSLAFSLWFARREFGLRARVVAPSEFADLPSNEPVQSGHGAAGEKSRTMRSEPGAARERTIWSNPWFRWNKHLRRAQMAASQQ